MVHRIHCEHRLFYGATARRRNVVVSVDRIHAMLFGSRDLLVKRDSFDEPLACSVRRHD